jgi:hypothetical protein
MECSNECLLKSIGARLSPAPIALHSTAEIVQLALRHNRTVQSIISFLPASARRREVYDS